MNVIHLIDMVEMVIHTSINLTPNVRLQGNFILHQCLRCHPLDVHPLLVIVDTIHHELTASKICHLHQIMFSYQTVPSSKVPGKKSKGESEGAREERWEKRREGGSYTMRHTFHYPTIIVSEEDGGMQ